MIYAYAIVAVILLAAVTYGLICARKGYKLVWEGCHPKRSQEMDLGSIAFKFRRFSFRSANGALLSAIEYIPDQKRRGTILACHYLGGSKTSIYSYIEPLVKKGFAVVAFDYPNHGESMDVKGNHYSLEDDMKRFIEKIKALGIEGPYGTLGFSMGATIALSAVDTLPEVKAVVVDSGPLIFVKDYFNYVLKNKQVRNKISRLIFLFYYCHVIGFCKMSKTMRKRLERIKGLPVLLIHSERDNIISYKNALYTYQQLGPENARLYTVKRAHHLTNRAVLGAVYDTLLIEFYEKWMER